MILLEHNQAIKDGKKIISWFNVQPTIFNTDPVAQSVASLIADLGVVSLIPSQSHTFLEIDHEIFSMVILFLQLIQEGLVSVTSERMYMNDVLVNC